MPTFMKMHPADSVPGAAKVSEHGVCPAAVYEAADGFLDGTNGGRACAFNCGTFCDDVVQGTHRDRRKNCERCDFFQLLLEEHGSAVSAHAFCRFLEEHLNKR